MQQMKRNELVKIQISSNTTGSTITNRLSQIIAIKLSDNFVSGTDYFWNEVLADYTITTTPTAQAVTASFTLRSGFLDGER